MLTPAQRIDILKIAVDLSKSVQTTGLRNETNLDALTVEIFRTLKSEVERGGALDDTSVSDVKAALDLASSFDEIVE